MNWFPMMSSSGFIGFLLLPSDLIVSHSFLMDYVDFIDSYRILFCCIGFYRISIDFRAEASETRLTLTCHDASNRF